MPVSTQSRARRATPSTSDAPDSPAAAQRALDQAALIRAQGASARQDAAALVQAAREALAAAERRARLLGSIAEDGDRLAGEFESRAAAIDAARALREQQAPAQAVLEALAAEYVTLTDRAAELDQRLGELAAERTQEQERLAASRAGGKVAEVGASRTQLAALDEVAADLRGQLQATRARLQEIDLPGAGRLLDQARREVERLRKHYAERIDALGPHSRNLTLRATACHFLRFADRCEGGAERARHAQIVAILDGEPGFTAAMAEARAYNDAMEQRNGGGRTGELAVQGA